MGTISKSVLIVYVKYYQDWTMFDETTADKSWRVFF